MSVCVLGAMNLDWVARVASLPRPGETVLASSVSRHPGGKGLNQAVAAARAGAQVRMIGQVGADEAGVWLLDVLRQAGVDTAYIERSPGAPTGQAFISVSADGENCIVVAAGANASLSLAPAKAASDARVMLAQLETAIDPIAAMFAADRPDLLKVLNAAPALPAGAGLFGYCDILVLNETELAAYSGLPGSPETVSKVVQAARRLLSRAGQSVVVTLGAQGRVVVSASDAFRLGGRPAFVVDTVGAGDCFCGVLAAALDEGLELRAAAARANVAAALAVGRPGVADAMPTRAEIEAAAPELFG